MYYLVSKTFYRSVFYIIGLITTNRKENMENNYRTGEVTQLRRIADALEEILRMVKKDQEDAAARRKQYEEEN